MESVGIDVFSPHMGGKNSQIMGGKKRPGGIILPPFLRGRGERILPFGGKSIFSGGINTTILWGEIFTMGGNFPPSRKVLAFYTSI